MVKGRGESSGPSCTKARGVQTPSLCDFLFSGRGSALAPGVWKPWPLSGWVYSPVGSTGSGCSPPPQALLLWVRAWAAEPTFQGLPSCCLAGWPGAIV